MNENKIYGFPEILDLDIATVEALHDNLLDKKIITTKDGIHEKYLSVVKKLYHIKDLQVLQDNISKNKKELNTLEEANNIIFKRAEEKQREYGPIDESLEDTATVASIISNKEIDIEMVYAVLMGLKISRMRWNKKHDTFLDSIGYTAAYENYLIKKQENE